MTINKDDFTEMLIRRNEKDIERMRAERMDLIREAFALRKEIWKLEERNRQLKGEDEIDDLL